MTHPLVKKSACHLLDPRMQREELVRILPVVFKIEACLSRSFSRSKWASSRFRSHRRLVAVCNCGSWKRGRFQVQPLRSSTPAPRRRVIPLCILSKSCSWSFMGRSTLQGYLHRHLLRLQSYSCHNSRWRPDLRIAWNQLWLLNFCDL